MVHRHRHISLSRQRILLLPQARHRLLLRIKVQPNLSVESIRPTPRNTLLVPREREVGHTDRHRDGDVNPDLSALNVLLERLRCRPGLGEDGHAVAVLVGVDEINGVGERLDLERDEHGTEDLLGVALHVWLDARDDSRADPVTVGELGVLWLVSPSVEEDGGALLFGAGNQTLDALLAVLADDGAEIRVLLETTVEDERLGEVGELGEPLLALGDHDERAERHASLACGTEGGADDGVESVVLVAVWQHRGVVLGAQVGLDTLAVLGTAGVDVLSGLVAADEADGLDLWCVEDEVHSPVGAVDDVKNTIWEASLLCELSQDHGRAGVTLRWLQDQAVTGDSGDWDRPKRDHGGEVERADSSHNTERLAVIPRLHILSNLQHLASKLRCDTARALGDLQTTVHISLGVRENLALLEGDGRGQTVPVLADQLHELKHDLLAGDDAGGAPSWEGGLGAGDGGAELLVGVLRDAGDEVVGGGVVEVDELAGGRGDELVVDEEGGVLGVLDLLVRGWVGGRGGGELDGGVGGGLLGPRGDGQVADGGLRCLDWSRGGSETGEAGGEGWPGAGGERGHAAGD